MDPGNLSSWRIRNLVKFKGYVAISGAVRASVTIHGKYATVGSRAMG
jgi:hypothetical protein